MAIADQDDAKVMLLNFFHHFWSRLILLDFIYLLNIPIGLKKEEFNLDIIKMHRMELGYEEEEQEAVNLAFDMAFCPEIQHVN